MLPHRVPGLGVDPGGFHMDSPPDVALPCSSHPFKLISLAFLFTKFSITKMEAWPPTTRPQQQSARQPRTPKHSRPACICYPMATLRGRVNFYGPWDAAKHMESAAALAKDLHRWNEVSDHCRKASELYMECGRSQPASDALAKGASALEDTEPDEAIRMYNDACGILEEDGKEQMAFDLYRSSTSIYIKLEKYMDAAIFLLRWGAAADKCNAVNSQCKAYLSAIIVYLYAHDFKQAQKCYNDCTQITAFLGSDQHRCASKLFSAYREGDVEEIQRVAQSSAVSHLDHTIIRLARKLPTGDLEGIKAGAEEDDDIETLDDEDLRGHG
ncbi:Gamma-soluble NSF attachment protein [Platanthera guangdongensis]|uniref:Gamma-soluble NSF attachment protein n=1 Tax=Platanthera guangdongensis TaxID=2320717 RepID=A0ABR2LKC5_9ASPA